MVIKLWSVFLILLTILQFLQRSTTPLVKPHNFVHPDDHLVLEDESGRVKLAGMLSPSVYVTGLCQTKYYNKERKMLYI